jgi:acyl carrier protein
MDRIRAILSKVIDEINKDITAVADEDNLLEIGLNSISFIHLVLEMEKEFQVFVSDKELIIEDFDTIAKIKRYLEANG